MTLFEFYENLKLLHFNESYITDLEEKEEHYAACYIWVEREGKNEEADIQNTSYNYFLEKKS